MTYRVAIVGSRDFPDEKMVRSYIQRLPLDTVIVSGGAKGPDTWAVEEARRRGMQTVEFLPDWEAHGKAAGAIRNKQIVDNCDWLVAYWDGTSRGTRNTVQRCLKGDVPHALIVWRPSRGLYELQTTVDPSTIRLNRPDES